MMTDKEYKLARAMVKRTGAKFGVESYEFRYMRYLLLVEEWKILKEFYLTTL